MEQDTAKTAKAEVRARVRAARNAMTEAAVKAAAASLTEQLIQFVTARGARSVSCYLPVRNEPDTQAFIAWARENGIRVLLPSCRQDLLLDWIEPESDETVPGLYGIPEAIGKVFSPLEVGETDLMLIPACAVDEQGTRLGWGGGFFDRTLGSMEQRPDVFAVIYDAELVAELPHEMHDIPVTGVVTPQAVHYLDRAPLTSSIPIVSE